MWKMKKRIKKVKSTVSGVKTSKLFDEATENASEDSGNIRTDSKQKVFGRRRLRNKITRKLLKPLPQSSNASSCYSVIGIHGVAGSGKTTFALHIRDYIEKRNHFDTIMCVSLSKTFSVDGIFQEMLKDIAAKKKEMLKDITGESHTNISDRDKVKEKLDDSLRGEKLKEKLKESLDGKCFFLILDDLWVGDRTSQQLQQLLSPLNGGKKGSKILVTARTETAARVLCPFKIYKLPSLDGRQYYKMFMHRALNPESDHQHDAELKRLGKVIVKKLHKSPIAAMIVAGQLQRNNIEFWKKTAEDVRFVDTWDVLWWSYQELPLDIRRCLDYCNIFPPRTKLKKKQLVRLWIAQGFVRPSATEGMKMEDIAEGYVQRLVSCSFLEPTRGRDDCFTIHDMLHDLLDKVVGSDCFRIENERSQLEGRVWNGDVPQEVRHLFVQKYDGKLITAKICGLENLRTLIIYVAERDTPLEEEVIDSICKTLLKLRVLIIAFSSAIYQNKDFSFPESIGQLKYLRYLGFKMGYSCMVILPSAPSKLTNLLYIIGGRGEFANIGRLISLQKIRRFTVRQKEGYEVHQLRDLNKLRGKLEIRGLENVKRKEDAIEANLDGKELLTELELNWCAKGSAEEVLTKLELNWCTKGSAEPEAEIDAGPQAEVLESLRPPKELTKLEINGYKGLRYPSWMVCKQKGRPKKLQLLCFEGWSQLGHGPELEGFPKLRVLEISECSWNTLPRNVKKLRLLEELIIDESKNIEFLPKLPKSLQVFCLRDCNDKLMRNCLTRGDPNYQKIEHIPEKHIIPSFRRRRSEEDSAVWLEDLARAGPCLEKFGLRELPDKLFEMRDSINFKRIRASEKDGGFVIEASCG